MKNTNPFKQKILTVMIASAGAGGVYADEVQNTDEKDEVIHLETVVVKAEEKSSFQAAKKFFRKSAGRHQFDQCSAAGERKVWH
ncbi:hypothetical protein [Acinetobacter sp. CAAS 2-6]|uniref:hypothetical protein n=1 Tax=Acinetobacter sp. CAAS 2-6 TaxID=3016358 RepID=UPI002DD68AE5|nr:hypothetical protein [Acinetobacter sp. CAAS 2-6]